MKPTATTRMTVELPVQLKDRLEEIAKTTDVPSADLAVDAITSYVEIQEWQIRQIEEGLREADAGDFAGDEEVAAVFAKWLNAR
jgi:RHH-type transcriptional regulator, rel operon repressor / antitoxin RelB